MGNIRDGNILIIIGRMVIITSDIIIIIYHKPKNNKSLPGLSSIASMSMSMYNVVTQNPMCMSATTVIHIMLIDNELAK